MNFTRDSQLISKFEMHRTIQFEEPGTIIILSTLCSGNINAPKTKQKKSDDGLGSDMCDSSFFQSMHVYNRSQILQF